MTGPARSHTEAVAAVGRALAAYETQAGVAADAALVAARRIATDAAAAQADRQRHLERAEADLRACRAEPEARCTAEQARVVQEQHGLEVARRAVSMAERAVRDLAASRVRFRSEAAALITPGRTMTSVKGAELEAYLSSVGLRAVASAGPGSSSAGPVSAQRPSGGGGRDIGGLPEGFELVALDLVDVPDPVTGRDQFGKGYSPEDMAWAFSAFDDVVLPALRAGEGSEYFASLDAAEGRMGTRSYSDTYSGFLGSDAIVLEARPGGRYELSENGRHRFWVAQQTGRPTVPALVRR
ncbi:hypothetical protein [Pseudonocardia xishanensis]|uniref:Uncharacterized protein n=1 Tax=Pseudonocardia xishanensis TaxID=630995 RepID=A0ABP8RCA9_9PSEU